MRFGFAFCFFVLLLASAHGAECTKPTRERKSFERALLQSGISSSAVFTLMAVPTTEHYAVIVSAVSPSRTVVALLYQHSDGMVQFLHRHVLHSHRLAKKALSLRVYMPKNGIASVCLAEYWYCEVHLGDERVVCEDL
jgi:hypothetical protein